jgi:hypothetical protein
VARERDVRRIFENKPGGRRRVGRPRLRGMDGAEGDLRTMVVQRWRNIAKKNGGELRGRPGPCMDHRATDHDDSKIMILLMHFERLFPVSYHPHPNSVLKHA